MFHSPKAEETQEDPGGKPQTRKREEEMKILPQGIKIESIRFQMKRVIKIFL